MKKFVNFTARHLAVFIFTIALSLVAVIGSAYGFTKVAEVASIDSSIPKVKSDEELNQEIMQKDTLSIPAQKEKTSTSLSVTPTQGPIKNSNTTKYNSDNSHDDSGNKPIISISPSFERDDDIEDMNDEYEKEEHVEFESSSEDN